MRVWEEKENDNIEAGSNRIMSSRDRYKFVRDRKY